GALGKLEQRFIRVFSGADRVEWQDELAQLGLINCCVRLNLRLCESRRFRICVGVEYGCRHGGVARPETEAAYLLRVSLARDRIRQMWNSARMRRCGPARETCHREVKATPEKMHRTAFATKTRAEFLKHPITL